MENFIFCVVLDFTGGKKQENMTVYYCVGFFWPEYFSLWTECTEILIFKIISLNTKIVRSKLF